MTTINAHKLQRMIKQTRPHISDDDTLPAINGIRLECDGVHIHALATDRYTFAVARAKVREETDTWTTTVSQNGIGSVRVNQGSERMTKAVTSSSLSAIGSRIAPSCVF